jgi:hypothetical protein
LSLISDLSPQQLDLEKDKFVMSLTQCIYSCLQSYSSRLTSPDQ